MTTGTDDRAGENQQQAETHGGEGFRLPSSGLTGILGGGLEEQLARAQERLAFYESFDRLIQENITRSGELMREAIDLRERARFEIEHGRAEIERRLATERERQRDVLASLFDQLDDVRTATDRLADRVADALADLAAPDSLVAGQAAAPTAIAAGEPAPSELEETAAEEPMPTGAGSAPDPFAAQPSSPGGEPAVLESNLEEVVEQHADLADEGAPAERPPQDEDVALLGDATGSGLDATATETEIEAAGGDGPTQGDAPAPTVAASQAVTMPPEPARAGGADIPAVQAPEALPSPTAEDSTPGPTATQAAPGAEPVHAAESGAEAPPDAQDTWPRPIMVLVHGVPRAAAALSLQRHLAGLSHVEGVEAREYAEGILRLQVTTSRALRVEDLRAWDGGRGLEPIHVQENVIEVKLPGAAGF